PREANLIELHGLLRHHKSHRYRVGAFTAAAKTLQLGRVYSHGTIKDASVAAFSARTKPGPTSKKPPSSTTRTAHANRVLRGISQLHVPQWSRLSAKTAAVHNGIQPTCPRRNDHAADRAGQRTRCCRSTCIRSGRSPLGPEAVHMI